MILRNVDSCLSSDTVYLTWRLNSSATPLWVTQTSQAFLRPVAAVGAVLLSVDVRLL